MADNNQDVEANKAEYEELYNQNKLFVRYPMDHVIRFYAYYLSQFKPGVMLDYGCGSGNHSAFFIQQGYEVHGLDVAEASLEQIKSNFDMYGIDQGHMDRITIQAPDIAELPYADQSFDVILANQVLYYLATEERIRSMCREFNRVLRPGGVVFFTMYGVRNYYYTHYLKQIHGGETCEILIDDDAHRLNGLKEMVYVVRDEEHLRRLFSDFTCINTGYLEMSMFDVKNNFHWIFTGGKQVKGG